VHLRLRTVDFDRLGLKLPLTGRSISVSFLPDLAAWKGKLVANAAGRGTAVYAASFIRKRKIVLDDSLRRDPAQLRFFLIHELFHFGWARLGNSKRDEFARLLKEEMEHGASGDLGESSSLKRRDATPSRALRWREYVCESFCDTAAWLYSGVELSAGRRLGRVWRERRKQWFEAVFAAPRVC
jgi:hypothetical protein